MKRDSIGHLEVQSNDIKMNISGKQESSFGSQDLRLRAVLSLMDFDFKFMQEEDSHISDKYYMTLLDRLGSLIKSDAGVEPSVDNLTFLKHYLDWLTDKNVCNDSEMTSFLEQYKDLEDE